MARRSAGALHLMARDERGSVTVEALVYVTLLVLLVTVMTDASVLYGKHAEMWNAGRDAARALARQSMTAAEAEQRIRSMLTGFEGQIQVAIDDGEVVIVEVQADFSDEAVFGALGAFASSRPARVVMRREPALLDRLG